MIGDVVMKIIVIIGLLMTGGLCRAIVIARMIAVELRFIDYL